MADLPITAAALPIFHNASMVREDKDALSVSQLCTRFYIDAMGFMWAGPSDGSDGFRYQRFEGIAEHKPQWAWRLQQPLPDFEEISPTQAWKVISRYLAEEE